MLLKAIRLMKSRYEKAEAQQNNEPLGEQIPKSEGAKCEKHADKEVEFYCQDCKTLICSICIVFQHNGHQLLMLEDSLTHLIKEMDDLEQFYDTNVMKEQNDSQKNEKIIMNIQKQLDQNKIKQVNFIRQGFEQIIEALIKKKESLIEETSKRYDNESSNFSAMIRPKTSIRSSHEIKSEAQSLKDLPISEKKDIYNKAQTIRDFNNHLSDIIKESQDRMSQTSKFRELESLENNPQFSIKSDFTPVTLDTTAAISYILNMTLENNSIINSKGSLLHKSNDQHQVEVHSDEDQIACAESSKIKDNEELESKPSNQEFKPENMNFMMRKLTNAIKGGEAVKPPPQNDQADFVDEEIIDEAKNHRKKHVHIPFKHPEKHGFYCVGDLPFMLFYKCDTKVWSKIDFSEESHYKGGLKYPSVVRVLNTDTIILTGGCDNYTGEASDSVYKANIAKIDCFERTTSMSHKRYGHCSLSIGKDLYVIGGFDHQDTETTSPSTLMSCEKYNEETNKWTNIANLVHSVAFAAICSVENNTLYLFGGFEDYSTVDIIQKYDCMHDKWELLTITLPIKLAKMGAANVENNYILIVGGIFEDMNSENPLSLISNSYKLNLTHLKWSTGSKMKNKRTLNSTLYFYDNQLYALGSSNQGACEKYDLEACKWINIPSYDHILPLNDLQSFSVCKYDE